MRAPRRVPWASNAELAELYDLIFLPGASTQSREAAMSRMSVYIASPSCPAFLHLLHALVGALLLPYPPTSAQEANVARMTYAMAVVRFVNGMVDPLQTGLHARPISHLAATLGLPASLVTLRHRATHEDLPPLSLLRRALEQATDYVHRNSFLPLLASSSAGVGWDKRARAEALVTRWKKTCKARVRARDVTAESASGHAVSRLKREVENEDPAEIIEAVVRVGLVPVGRKKRPSKRDAAPSQEALLVWGPLLMHLAATHPTASIASVLSQTVVGVIVDTAPRFQPPAHGMDPDAAEDARKELASYRWALGVWLRWLWEADAAGELSVPADERIGVLRRLARELVHEDDVLRRIYGILAATSDEGPALAEMDELLERSNDTAGADDSDEEMELEGLEVEIGTGTSALEEEVDVDAKVASMEANLRSLDKMLAQRPTGAAARAGEGQDDDGHVVKGWAKVDEWRACPIGAWAS